jgi:dsDNA-specific endonuclease/ATPase MutS2
MESDCNEEDFVVMPITGELDLHTFRPCDIKDLLLGYFEECIKVGILEVRVIHGKGTGTLRQTVHALLRKMPQVHSFRLGREGEGSWGATLVYLIQPKGTM